MANSSDYLKNRSVYEGLEVVRHYSSLEGLEPAEILLLEKYLKKGRVLDLGVGGGRTIPYLLKKSSLYLGLDYSPAMVAEAARKFPAADLRVMDASDLSALPSGSFDLILFSFNGIDYLHPYEKRLACFRECHRLLGKGGMLIFSTHHSRQLLLLPSFKGATGWGKKAWRIAYAGFRSLKTMTAIGDSVFWKGHGYRMDPVHGGLLTYCAHPASVRADLESCGFDLRETIATDPLGWSWPLAQGWYYYAAEKGGGE